MHVYKENNDGCCIWFFGDSFIVVLNISAVYRIRKELNDISVFFLSFVRNCITSICFFEGAGGKAWYVCTK